MSEQDRITANEIRVVRASMIAGELYDWPSPLSAEVRGTLLHTIKMLQTVLDKSEELANATRDRLRLLQERSPDDTEAAAAAVAMHKASKDQ